MNFFGMYHFFNLLPDVFNAAEACGETQIVCDDNTRIQALEVKDDERIAVEHGFRFENEWQSFHGSHGCALL